MEQQVLEGTWEEIVLHAAELSKAGKAYYTYRSTR
jgi:hypothetical protein